ARCAGACWHMVPGSRSTRCASRDATRAFQAQLAATEEGIPPAMLRKETQVQRPRRWDTPFGPDMDDAAVARLLATAPFCRMDPARFPLSWSLPDTLRGDTRIVRFQHGDLIVREGDYGNSAFLVLSGKVRIALQRLPRELLGRAAPARGRPLRALANL